jgi:hypothetical protein
MKTALATLAAVLLLAGCGHAKDPFVGTWKRANGPPYPPTLFVIAKTADGYRLTGWFPVGRESAALTRKGDDLDGHRVMPTLAVWNHGSFGSYIKITWDPTSNRLLWLGVPMTKVSDSTAAPVP